MSMNFNEGHINMNRNFKMLASSLSVAAVALTILSTGAMALPRHQVHRANNAYHHSYSGQYDRGSYSGQYNRGSVDRGSVSGSPAYDNSGAESAGGY
jgi:hypothetical protein